MSKRYKIIILLILVILTIFIEIFIYPSDIAIFENNTIIYYKNDKILKISHPKKISGRYSFSKFSVYNGKNFEDGYINFLNEDNFAYSEVYKDDYSKMYVYPLIACTNGLKLKITEATEENNYNLSQEENENIKKVLLDNNLSEEYTSFSKSIVDKVSIYSINNYKKDSKEYYSIVFSLNNEGKYSILDKSLYNDDLLNVKKVSLFGQLDIDMDGDEEIVITETLGDDAPIYYYFYKYDSVDGTLTKFE